MIVSAVILLGVGGFFGSTMFIGGNEDSTSIEENPNDSIVNAVKKLNQASSKPDKMSEETKVDSTARNNEALKYWMLSIVGLIL